MFRVIQSVIFWAVAIAAVSAVFDEEKRKKCMPLMHPKTLSCCTKMRPLMEMEKADFTECSGLSMKPTTCEFEVCLGKKIGVLSDDGSLDKKSITDLVDKVFTDDSKIAEVLKKECVNSDIEKYAPMPFCDMIKFKNCVHTQLLMQCPEFSSEAECSGTKALVEECMTSSS